MDISKEWYKSELIRHESLLPHIPFETEFNEYVAIAEGNIEYVTKHHNDESFKNPEGKGKLSENPIQNLRYHFVVATALITRYCVMNGMELEKAYTLSDFYILKMDKCTTIPEIVELHNRMCFDFCNKMHIHKKENVLSKPVVLCLDYIYNHIHFRITIAELAEYVKLSESHLSKIFHKEVGMPISSYINMQKIEKAKHLLSYSDYSLSEIANYLSFSSQSHFIQVFQKLAGTTPGKYRNKHFRSEWSTMDTNS